MEEEDDEGPPPMEPETGPPLFTPLSEDTRVEGLNAWTARISSFLAPDRAVAVLRSSVWPGAVAYATNGKLVLPFFSHYLGITCRLTKCRLKFVTSTFSFS